MAYRGVTFVTWSITPCSCENRHKHGSIRTEGVEVLWYLGGIYRHSLSYHASPALFKSLLHDSIVGARWTYNTDDATLSGDCLTSITISVFNSMMEIG